MPDSLISRVGRYVPAGGTYRLDDLRPSVHQLILTRTTVTMGHKRSREATEREAKTALALEGVWNGTYADAKHAADSLGVSASTLSKRLKGRKSKSEARETQQHLSRQEEKALVDWISQATATGNPVPHEYSKEMAEEIKRARVGDGEFMPPFGTTWTRAFLKRYPQLKTKLSKAIESARAKDVTREQILAFNQEFRQVIQEKQIKPEHIYNCDETGIASFELT